MLTTAEIVELSARSRNYVTKMLKKKGIKSERRNGKTSGYIIYYDITDEQIKEGRLEETSPEEIAMQQGASLLALESLFRIKRPASCSVP